MGYVEVNTEQYRNDLSEALEKDGWELDSDGEFEVIASKKGITISIVKLAHNRVYFDVGFSIEVKARPATQASLAEALCVAKELEKTYDYISWQTGGNWFDAGCDHNEEDLPLSDGMFIIDGYVSDQSFDWDVESNGVNPLTDWFMAYGLEQQDYAKEDAEELVDIAEDENVGIGDF